MKLTTLFLTVACLSAAAGGRAQRVSINVDHAPVQKVFLEVIKQTGISIIYNMEVLKNAKPVTIHMQNAPVEEVILRCLDGLPCSFSFEQGAILIKKIAQSDYPPGAVTGALPIPSLLLEIKGRVRDENGEPAEGISVTLKGKKTGTATDADGRFSLQADQGDVLIFSSVNFKTVEVPVSQEFIEVTLTPQFKPLEQLIVSGNVVEHERKADISSVTVLRSKDLEKLPAQRLDQIFTGIIPGTFLPDQSQDNLFGGGYRLSIRGANSFSGSETKVYVDGIELANGSSYLANLDMNSVERIEVVRGPSAATLYGSQANGGVILVFTKKGKRNVNSIDLTSAAGFIHSKWVDGNAFQQDHAFSLTQGFEHTSVAAGGGYRMVGAYLPYGGEKTYSSYLTITNSSIRKLDITVEGHYTHTDLHGVRNPVFDDVTDPAFKAANPDYFRKNYSQGNISTASAALNLSYHPLKNWTHNLTAGYSHNESFFGIPLTEVPGSFYGTNSLFGSLSRYNQPTLRYNNVLSLGSKEAWAFELLSGAETTSFATRSNYWYISPLSGRDSGKYQFSSVESANNKIRNHGFFVQAAPSFRDKYFLTLAYRLEKSNTFHTTSSNPRVGFTTNFTAGTWTLKPRIAWGQAISLPPYTALHPVPSTSSYVVFEANPDIRPQEQKGFDYGLEVYNEGLRFEAAYFDNKLKNANFLSVRQSGSTSYYKTINIGRVRNSGIELSASYEKNRFTIGANYSLVNPVVQEDFTVLGQKFKKGDRILYIAHHTYGAFVAYHFGASPISGLDARLSMDGVSGGSTLDLKGQTIAYFNWVQGGYQGAYPALLDYITGIPSVVHVNANLVYRFSERLSATAEVRNIFNNYRSTLFNTTAIAGANYLFGLHYHFQK